MNVLIITVAGSLALAALFIVLFLASGRTRSIDQDSLLPLTQDDGKLETTEEANS